MLPLTRLLLLVMLCLLGGRAGKQQCRWATRGYHSGQNHNCPRPSSNTRQSIWMERSSVGDRMDRLCRIGFPVGYVLLTVLVGGYVYQMG
jgi:hypothetical protein